MFIKMLGLASEITAEAVMMLLPQVAKISISGLCGSAKLELVE